jgi:hypothetical protein
MPSYFIHTAEHWRQRAKEMRALADTVVGRGAQDTMLRMAQHYERLATREEQLAREARPVLRKFSPRINARSA